MKFAAKLILASLFVSSACFAQTDSDQSVPIYFYSVGFPQAEKKPGIKDEEWQAQPFYGFKRVRPLLTAIRDKKLIRNYLSERAAKEIAEYFHSTVWQAMKVSSRASWAELDRVPLETLLEDIRNSPVLFQHSCQDEQGIEREATTRMNVKAAEICYNPVQIVRADDNWYEPKILGKLAALVIHESLHHFGVWDANNVLREELAKNFTYWYEKQVPEPKKTLVSKWFNDLRNEYYQSPRLDASKLNGNIRYTCEPVRYRENAGSAKFQSELKERIQNWYQLGFELRSSLADESIYFVVNKTKPDYIYHQPKTYEETWFDLFAYYADYRNASSQVDQQARVSSDGSVLIELTELQIGRDPANPPEGFVPALSHYSENALGFVRCRGEPVR